MSPSSRSLRFQTFDLGSGLVVAVQANHWLAVRANPLVSFLDRTSPRLGQQVFEILIPASGFPKSNLTIMRRGIFTTTLRESVRGNPSPGDFTLDASDNRSMISSILRWPFGPINFNTPEIMTKMIGIFLFPRSNSGVKPCVSFSERNTPKFAQNISIIIAQFFSSINKLRKGSRGARTSIAPIAAFFNGSTLVQVRRARVRCNLRGQVLVQRDFDQVVPLDIGLSPLGRMFKQFPT